MPFRQLQLFVLFGGITMDKGFRDLKDTHQLVQEYLQIAKPLFLYLPWLEKMQGAKPSSTYSGSEIADHSISFPVYDSTLMRFVREASRNPLMDKNYRYIFTRHGIRTVLDERRVIEKATLKDWNILRGILSKYVLGGMTKGTLWSQAITDNIFYLTIKQMKYVLEYWDKPIES
jgi:hypothetical protein